MFCRNCGAKIDDKAEICIHCGVRVNTTEKKSSGIAAIASFFFPGLGQIYNAHLHFYIENLCQESYFYSKDPEIEKK